MRLRRSLVLSLCLVLPARVRAFTAAAGKVDITPDLSREKVWLAGFGASGRPVKGIHDPLYARAVVVSDGERTVALVALDCIGVFREDVEDMRRRLGWDGEKRYLFVAATHVHSGPDTMGLWGRFPGVSGVDERYRRRLKDSVTALVRDLEGKLRPAELIAAKREVDPRGLCKDSRDPVVLDPELDAFALKAGGKALATVVRWSCHPEVLGSDNFQLTADFPGRLCSRVEERGGGTCVYFSGAIGGLLTPDVDRSLGVEHQFSEAGRIGRALADAALAALKEPGARTAGRGKVLFARRIVRLPVENSRYLLFLPSLVFGHRLFDAGGSPLKRSAYALALRHLILFPLPDKLRPRVETEVSRVRLGPVDILGIPGEPFPELAIGGYDGSRTYGHPLVRPDNPNPPDLKRAPRGPYLRARLGAYGLIVGLANDEVGYIIPGYDFKANPDRSMSPQPPGHHYEETNSIGPSATSIILGAVEELLK